MDRSMRLDIGYSGFYDSCETRPEQMFMPFGPDRQSVVGTPRRTGA
jgi:hypothetical protein